MLSKSQNKCWKSDYHLALLTMLSALRHGWGVLALCVRVIQGSATHYSNHVWVVLCEEWVCQCMYLCSYVCVAMLVWDSELPTHPYSLKMDMMSLLQTQQHRCAVSCNNQSIRVCGGKSKWSFLLVISIRCKTVTEKFESMLISRSADAEQISKQMLEIWLSSCSSHYVECTKTWLRGFSSVC